MPSLIEPKIASGPIAKSNDAETNPSTNVLSSWARNFLRKLSPKASNRDSRLRAEPINPPISKDPRMASIGQPFGSEEINLSPHIGASALTAPKRVIKPSASVMRVLVRSDMRAPTRTPSDDPTIIVTIFTVVPKPTNIAVTIEDINCNDCYKLPKWKKAQDLTR